MSMRLKALLAIWVCMLPLISCIGQKDDPGDLIPVEEGEDGSTDSGTRFFRRTLALEFTALWCQYCPQMGEALSTAKRERPGRIVEICIHQGDALSVREADAIVKEFKVSAWPSMVFDLDASTRFSEQSKDRMLQYVDAKSGEAPCGIAIESILDCTSLEGKVKVTAKKAGDYAVGAVLVEDGIPATQAGVGDNYVNNAVLRGILLGEDIHGKSVGHLDAGVETEAAFSMNVNDLGENLRIVAYVVQQDRVVNAEHCPVNEKKSYRYEKD